MRACPVGYRLGRKVATVVHGILAGADCIDDLAVLRAGATERILPTKPMAPSTVATWLRELTFDHIRQLDKLTEAMLTRAWAAGAGPGATAMTTDIDSTICEVHGYAKQGAGYGYSGQLAHNVLRWTARLGALADGAVVAKTLRRRLLTIPGRLTRSARKLTLHLPTRWPWAKQFTRALQRLRTLPALC